MKKHKHLGTLRTGERPRNIKYKGEKSFGPTFTIIWILLAFFFAPTAIAQTGDGAHTGITANAPGGGAPTDATYITQTSDGDLSDEQAMGALATGIVKNTTTSGVQSIAVAGTDYSTSSATETLTNKTIDANGTGNSITNIDLTADIIGTLPIANGGTNATDAATALSNLGGIGAATTDTLTNKTLDSSTNTIHADIVYIDARNVSGSTITAGSPVYASGYNAGQDKIEIELSSSSASATMPSIGIPESDILNNANGHVIVSGNFNSLDTTGTPEGESWSVGDTLYVSPTLGELSNVKPTGSTELIQAIAEVVRTHATLGRILVKGAGRANDVPNTISASIISIATGVGTPTIDQVQEYFDNTGSSGYFEGGALSDGGAGTLDVAAGSGFIRATASDTAAILSFKWSASAGIAVTDNTTQYVFVDDTGAITLNSDEFLEAQDNILLGVVTDDSGAVSSVFNLGVRLQESIGQAGRFMRRTHGILRDSRRGGLIFGQSGDANRDVTMTTGHLWWGRSDYTMSAFDTSAADTFDTYSASGLEASGASAWPNGQYDNAGTLTAITSNRWVNLYFYLSPDDSIVMVYGRNQYTSEALAAEETVPSTSLPNIITSAGILATRFTFKESTNSATIASAFDTVFAANGVTDHGNLAGLGDDDHTQYLLADGSRALAGAWDMGSQALTNVNIDSGTIDGITAVEVDGNLLLQNQSSAPSSTAGYTTLYALEGAFNSTTKLLIHADSDFTDSSGNAHTPTVTGATIDTGTKKFGAGSGLFVAASSQYVTYPDDNHWFFGTGEFTIDLWVNFNTLTGSQFVLSNGDYIAGGGWVFWRDGSTNTLYFQYFPSGNPSTTTLISASWTPSTGTWYHVLLSKDSSDDYRLFIDGTQIGSDSNNTDLIPNSTERLFIGAYRTNGSITGFVDAYIDEVHISKGVARETANFTSPTEAYSPSRLLFKDNMSEQHLATSSNDLSIFGATTSLELASVLTDETGTGSMVLSVAPVFTAIAFEGSTADDFEHSINSIDLTADRSFNFPDDELVPGDILVSDGVRDLAYLHLAAAEIVIGAGSLIPTNHLLSGDATMSGTGVVTVGDDSHNHTGSSLSNVDVADLANGTDGELITWDAAGAPATVAAGTSGQVLTSNGAGAAPTFQAGGGGGTFTWVNKTGAYTAVAGDGVFVGTVTGAITITLPATPSLGDEVAIIDQEGNAATNNITVGRNGSNIMGLTEDMTMNQDNDFATLVYSGDATDGWRIR